MKPNPIILSECAILENSHKATFLKLELDYSLYARIVLNACADVHSARAVMNLLTASLDT